MLMAEARDRRGNRLLIHDVGDHYLIVKVPGSSREAFLQGVDRIIDLDGSETQAMRPRLIPKSASPFDSLRRSASKVSDMLWQAFATEKARGSEG